jgi:SAM-dependent methyltransferase
MTPDEIRAYWTDQARIHGAAPAASWSDIWAIDLEIRELSKWIDDGDRVLDVGCGNGYSAAQLAARRRIHLRGLDYVPALIDHARARAAGLEGRLAGTLNFAVGDITALTEPEDTYDVVLTTRVLINLGSWASQTAVAISCGRRVRPGGLLLLSEATLQGWKALNGFRAEWGLPPIPIPSFNTYLDQEKVIEALSPEFDLVTLVDFASTYYVGTRVFKPLLGSGLGHEAIVPVPDTHWNRWWSQLPAAGDYGVQKLFVFSRKANG